MRKKYTNTVVRSWPAAALLTLTMALATAPAHGQTATLFGALTNFDVYNDTGQDAHGFEIELDGVAPQQISATFGATRYGAPVIVPFTGGVYVRYQSAWNGSAWTATTTAPITAAPTGGHSCVLTNIVGCDHYGVVTLANASAVVYRWLVPDPQIPGNLIRFAGPPVSIPAPVVSILPPAQPGAQPVIAFHIEAPPPPPAQWGPAKWVKVYKTELPREVGLDELVGDNPVVPEDPNSVETGWKLLQKNPNGSGNSGVLHSQGILGSGSHSVIRRYEFYKYTGAFDPATHEALCADPTCSAPGQNEVGDFIGAQMAAANVGIPSVTVTRIGNGTVTGANGKINCGGSCTTAVAAGSPVTLNANSASNTIFSGWDGPCAGLQPTCNLTVNEADNVTATFTPIFTLSIGRGGSGTVTGNPAGLVSTQIACGSSCSAKFAQGTTVTLMAAPSTGLNFLNWTGACSGTAPQCVVTINSNTQVQANFK